MAKLSGFFQFTLNLSHYFYLIHIKHVTFISFFSWHSKCWSHVVFPDAPPAAWRVAAGHLGRGPTATTLVVAAEAGAPGRSEGDGAAVAMPAGPTNGEVGQAIAA